MAPGRTPGDFRATEERALDGTLSTPVCFIGSPRVSRSMEVANAEAPGSGSPDSAVGGWKMSEVYKEKLTSSAGTVVITRKASPVDIEQIHEGADLFKILSTMSDEFRPENYSKADGAPMTLFSGSSARIDLSKRSVEDMGFWHRSADFNEVILCLKGALHWQTELGETVLRPGDMIWIPRGIAHRSLLCEESLEENVLIEFKIREDLKFVATAGSGND